MLCCDLLLSMCGWIGCGYLYAYLLLERECLDLFGGELVVTFYSSVIVCAMVIWYACRLLQFIFNVILLILVWLTMVWWLCWIHIRSKLDSPKKYLGGVGRGVLRFWEG